MKIIEIIKFISIKYLYLAISIRVSRTKFKLYATFLSEKTFSVKIKSKDEKIYIFDI